MPTAQWNLESLYGVVPPSTYGSKGHVYYDATYGGPYIVASFSPNDAITVWKPTGNDPNNTWVEQDSANRPSPGVFPTGSHTLGITNVLKGTKIHIMWSTLEFSAGARWYYSRFDISTNTWDAVNASATFVLIDSGASATSTGVAHRHTLILRHNGDLYWGAQGDENNNKLMGGSYDYPCYYLSTDDGATWSGPNALISVNDIGQANATPFRWNLGTSNRVHCIGNGETGASGNNSYDRYARHRTLRADNTLDTLPGFWFYSSPENSGPSEAGPDGYYQSPANFYFYWQQGATYTARYVQKCWYASADTLSPSRAQSGGDVQKMICAQDVTNGVGYLCGPASGWQTPTTRVYYGSTMGASIVISSDIGGQTNEASFGWYDRGGTKLAVYADLFSTRENPNSEIRGWFFEYSYGPVTSSGAGVSTPALSGNGVGSLAVQPLNASTSVAATATVATFKLTLPTFVELVATPVVSSAAGTFPAIVRTLVASPIAALADFRRDVHKILAATPLSHVGSFSTGDVGGVLTFNMTVNAVPAALETIFYTYVNRSKTEAALGQVAYGDLTQSPQQYSKEETATVTTSATELWEKVYLLITSVTTSATMEYLRGISLPTVVVTSATIARRVFLNLVDTVVTIASTTRRMFKTLSTSVVASVNRGMSFLFDKVATVTTTATMQRLFTFSPKSTVVNIIPTLTPGKIIHQLWTAVVNLSPVALVRRIYTEVHLATVGVLGFFSKARIYIVSALASVATSATLFLARVRELAASVATSVTVSFFQQKVLRATVEGIAMTSKGIYWTILGTVGTNARRFRKFTDQYVATVGVTGLVAYKRLRTFLATVGLRTVFTRTVIKPVSTFVDRIIVMVKRITNSAVIQEPAASTIRDCGDLIVIEGKSMAELNLTIKQGATFDLTLTWNDSAGNPIDLTGYTARMQIREALTDAAFAHEMTTANGGIVLGGAAGTIQLIISSVDTAAFTWEEGVYDLEMISDVGPPEVVRRLLEGCVTVTPEVTR